MNLADLPEVIQIGGYGYLVRSKSHDGYLVLVNGKDCSGEHCRGRQTCRHRRIVRVHQQAAERQRARPTVPPAIGMLCD